MKKKLLLLIMIISAGTLNAQVFTEYFENATSGMNLEDYNDWYVSFKSSEALGVSPLIEEETLFYDGYIGSDTGNVVVLDSLVGWDSSTQRISTKVVTIGGDTLRPIVGDTMYYALIVSILPNSKTSYRDFMTWEASTGSNFSRGRVFAKISDDNMDLNLAVSKNSSSELAESEVMAGGVGVYHLLVLSYQVIEGDANDVITLYINPDPTKPEAEQTNKLVNIDSNSDYTAGSSKIKINVRQRGIGAKIGGIRVGTNWEEVLQGEQEPDVTSVKEAENSVNEIRAFSNTIITSGPGSVQVYDISGRKIISQDTNGRLDTSLRNGIYLVRYQDNNGKVVIGKVGVN